MDPSVLKDISRRFRHIDTRPLTDGITKYIRLSAAVSESLRNPDLNGERAARILDACRWEMTDDIAALLAELTDVRGRFVDLRYQENGRHKGVSEASEPARQCFGVLKHHGMELLAHLTDEVGIVGETIRMGEQVRGILSDHAVPMRRAARLLDILLERFARRPTVAYRVDGGSADVRQLTYAVEGMEGWKSDADSTTGDGSAESLRVATLSPFGPVIQSTWEELTQRRRNIAKAEADLKAGWRVLHRLSTKGCSRRILKTAKKLSAQHDARRSAFQQRVWASRVGDSFS